MFDQPIECMDGLKRWTNWGETMDRRKKIDELETTSAFYKINQPIKCGRFKLRIWQNRVECLTSSLPSNGIISLPLGLANGPPPDQRLQLPCVLLALGPPCPIPNRQVPRFFARPRAPRAARDGRREADSSRKRSPAHTHTHTHTHTSNARNGVGECR